MAAAQSGKKTIKVVVTESGVLQGSNVSSNNETQQGYLSIKSAKSMAAASMLGKGLINYGLSNVGKYTGNSQDQVRVNNAMELGGIAMTAMMNPYAAIAMVALKVATSVFEEMHRQKWERIELNEARSRAGYTNESFKKGR